MTILYTDPICLQHDTGAGHPERPARLEAVARLLRERKLIERCRQGTHEPASVGLLKEVHSPEQVELARTTSARGGYLDGDTPVSEKSFEVAQTITGAGLAAVDAVMRGEDKNAFCLIRPPGHHATPTRSMGFCLFNTIAFAAHHAKTKHDLSRILIVDWDVHHGNGTQDIFYRDPKVHFLSIHRYGGGFYPGTGAADETGEGPGAGTNRNVTMRFGSSREEFHDSFKRALEEAAEACKPELVLVSAGFDAHRSDPIGSLGLESEDFAVLTRRVLEVAETHAGGRLVSFLEGGYDLDALAESVALHLSELLGRG